MRGQGEPTVRAGGAEGEGRARETGLPVWGGREEKWKEPFSSQQQGAMGLQPCLWSVLLSSQCVLSGS